MVHVEFMVIPQATDTHSQYGACAVYGDNSGYRHTHNMVHVQFMVIPQATNTH